MASLPLRRLWDRQSALRLEPNPGAAAWVVQEIEGMLEERAPYKRRGYPRAGAFDRLAILAFWRIEAEELGLRYWLPGPRTVCRLHTTAYGTLEALLGGASAESLNCLVLVGTRREPGAAKYGAQNTAFACIEQGVFLEALHEALCRAAIPNHLQGGLSLSSLPVRLPLDVEGVLGLAA